MNPSIKIQICSLIITLLDIRLHRVSGVSKVSDFPKHKSRDEEGFKRRNDEDYLTKTILAEQLQYADQANAPHCAGKPAAA